MMPPKNIIGTTKYEISLICSFQNLSSIPISWVNHRHFPNSIHISVVFALILFLIQVAMIVWMTESDKEYCGKDENNEIWTSSHL